MDPFLSIIIPTKNRYEYLQVVLDILIKLKNEDLEIVVQDNSDEGKSHLTFLNYINEFRDNRIKYFYCNENLSINENSDKAVLNSKGKFICFIGDDDCVTSQIVNAAKWMEKESVDVLTFKCPIYIWTDVEFKYWGKKHTGVLSYLNPTGKLETKNPLIELNKLLGKGGQVLKEMPLLYHGIASREVLNKIFKVTGSFFPGSCPDMDVAVGLSLYAKKCIKADIPIIISGTAKKSAGGLGAAKMHKGDINKITTLPKDTAKTWNPYIPFFWSGPTIYADSITKCLERTGNEKLMERFNYNYLYAILFIFHSDFNVETRKAMKSNKNSSLLIMIYFATLLFMSRSYNFIKNRLPFFFKTNYLKIRMSTISEATRYMEDIIINMSLPWSKYI
jgi:glycosyltransferase involved in cell wall biosynthesis